MTAHWVAQVRLMGLGMGFTAVMAAGCGPSTPPDLLWQSGSSPGRDAFFDAFANGRYTDLDPILADLTEEAADGDDVSLAVLGFAHTWKLAEAPRLAPDPSTLDHIDVAAATFDRAVDAMPHDPRLVGFLGSLQLAQGSVWGDDTLSRKGWFGTKASARQWPEWGLFTQAYGLVSLSPDDKRFTQGIDLLWEDLDACADTRVEREDLDWTVYEGDVAADTDDWDRRACANTTVVPHNVEGFFTIFGDAYAKAGDLANADLMYANALASADAGTWPYRAVAEARRAELESLPELFNAEPADGPVDPSDTLVFSGPAGCTICHQASSSVVD